MAYVNTHWGARISPTKVRPVVDLIRGKPVSEALAILQTCKRRGAVFVHQALWAAMANADQDEADLHGLIVSDARVDKGQTIKRWQPKDRGRAHPIKKRTSHIRVAVDYRGTKTAPLRKTRPQPATTAGQAKRPERQTHGTESSSIRISSRHHRAAQAAAGTRPSRCTASCWSKTSEDP